MFSTAVDNQTAVTIHVLQGERPMAAQNKSIGQFNLEGIAPARRGVPQIEVTFDIDANGILNVSAKDKATGKEQAIRIEASSGLTQDEINRMKAEAEQNAENDKKERERVDKMNQADSMIFTTENFLKDNGDKIPADQKGNIESALQQAPRCPQERRHHCHRQRHQQPQHRNAGSQRPDVPASGRRTAGRRPRLHRQQQRRRRTATAEQWQI